MVLSPARVLHASRSLEINAFPENIHTIWALYVRMSERVGTRAPVEGPRAGRTPHNHT